MGLGLGLGVPGLQRGGRARVGEHEEELSVGDEVEPHLVRVRVRVRVRGRVRVGVRVRVR